jgi:hypothetical protein
MEKNFNHAAQKKELFHSANNEKTHRAQHLWRKVRGAW